MLLYYSGCGELSGHDAAYSLLAYAFCAMTGEALPRISAAEGGKPYFPDRPEIHFSVSHTKSHVLCAVGDCPVSADIETVREIRPRLNERVRTSAEAECFDFFESWVLKESYIKLRGGLVVPLRDMVFTGSRDNIACFDRAVSARLYDTVPGCRAAVCAGTQALPVRAEYVPADFLSSGKNNS